MKILAIESSCDETSAAILEKKNDIVSVISNITATSLSIHAKTGGIIPENAAREQVKYIIPVISETLCGDGQNWSKASEALSKDIDKIAVTFGPGLIGSLLVGVETAKSFAYIFNKPLIPVNHLLAHLYANYINRKSSDIAFPFLGLIVSGGHTDLLLFRSHKDYEWLGGTRDDAAGEALDKVGRLLGLTYPAGPEIEKRALLVKQSGVKFKSPLLSDSTFDFSFSGLKTEALRFVQSKNIIDTNLKNEICHALQKAIINVLVKKTLNAADLYGCKSILVGGGVSANQELANQLSNQTSIPVLFPEKKFTTDNAAMIGAYALMNGTERRWQEVSADPELYFA